jgi:hypothetical protein
VCSRRLYAPQLATLWPFGQVTVADYRCDSTMARRAMK